MTIDLDGIRERIAGSRTKPWRFVAHAYDDIAALLAEVARLRAERAWLVEEVLRQTGCTEAELTECMSVEGTHKPVVNRRMGAQIRECHALQAEIRLLNRAVSVADRLIARLFAERGGTTP